MLSLSAHTAREGEPRGSLEIVTHPLTPIPPSAAGGGLSWQRKEVAKKARTL